MAAATRCLSISWTSRKRWAILSTVWRGRSDLVEHRIVLVAVDEALDGAVERGREQQRLVAALDVAEHPLDLGHEPHVGHPVGLVEHDQPDVGQVGDLAVDQVDEPAGGGDDDLGTRLERVICLDICAPPYTATSRRSRASTRGRSTSVTWTASSRVGTSTRPGRTLGRRPWRPARRGEARSASVLPDPVLALPQTSRPARASGMQRRWTGNGVVRPASSSTATRSDDTPSAENVVGCSPGSSLRMVPADPTARPGDRPIPSIAQPLPTGAGTASQGRTCASM